jgi:hypothetical protein
MQFSPQRFLHIPFFNKEKVIVCIYLIACILVSLKIAFLETYDNYDCFKASYFHLIKNLDLYLRYPLEYNTTYNYSPVFAFLMGAYAYLPDWLGILLWNLTHTIFLLIAIHLMPVEARKKIFIYWFCLVEYITAAESVETNSAVAAVIMLIFIFQNKNNTTWSSFFFVFGFFFKIYIVTAGVFFLCFGKKGSFTLKALGWGLVFFSLPLLVVSTDQLIILYQSWIQRLQTQSLRDSLSILGVINLFKISGLAKEWIILSGTIIMLLVLFKKQVYHNHQFRLLYLAAILLFTVLFNPGVESPTYIIAITGVALWYINHDRRQWHRWLLLFVFVLTCLSPTELFPKFIRATYFVPYHIKAIPCILVWLICMFELFTWPTIQHEKNLS